MHQLINSWLKTIKHYLTTALQKSGVTVQGDVATELNDIMSVGTEIFANILDRIGKLEAATPVPLFERTLVWMIYNDMPIALEAFVANTDDKKPEGGHGRVFLIMTPSKHGNPLVLFERQIKGAGFFLNEQEAVIVCRNSIDHKIGMLRDIAETLVEGWSPNNA